MARHELVFANMESAFKVAELLLAECYVVMISREEQFFVLNYEYSEHCDRNDVTFMPIEDYEENISESFKQGRDTSQNSKGSEPCD